MEIHQIRYFLAACNELNFTHAAKSCGISQPSLTRAIQLLEKEFGGDLFRRHRTRIAPTELGRIVRPYFEEILQTTFTAKRVAEDFTKRSSNDLRLGVMSTIGSALILKVLEQLRSAHPSIQLAVTEGNADSLEGSLLAGEIDAAIYSRPFKEKNSRINHIELFSERMMIAVAKSHRLAKYEAVDPSDLVGEAFVRRRSCEFSDIVSFHKSARDNSACRTTPQPNVYESDREECVLAMIAGKFGFGFLPEHSIRHEHIVARPLVSPAYYRRVLLATIADRPHSHAAGALVNDAMRSKWVELFDTPHNFIPDNVVAVNVFT